MSSMTFQPAIKDVLDSMLLPVSIVTPGKMFGLPAYYIGKRLFACVYEDSVGLKLPADRAAMLIGQAGVTPFVPMGRRQMKAWVQLSREHPSDFREDMLLFEESIAYVAALDQ